MRPSPELKFPFQVKPCWRISRFCELTKPTIPVFVHTEAHVCGVPYWAAGMESQVKLAHQPAGSSNMFGSVAPITLAHAEQAPSRMPTSKRIDNFFITPPEIVSRR